MKTFRDYISEENVSNKREENIYVKFLDLYNDLTPVYDDIQYGSIDIFEKKLYDSENIAKDLDEYEKLLNKVEELASKLYDDKKYSSQMIYVKKNLEAAKRNIDGYRIKNDIIQTILDTVRIGDTIEEVTPKISKMTKELKSYDVVNKKYAGKFFDYYSEHDIMDEFSKFGCLKLHGEMDLYVTFDEDRIVNVYYEKVTEVNF